MQCARVGGSCAGARGDVSLSDVVELGKSVEWMAKVVQMHRRRMQ